MKSKIAKQSTSGVGAFEVEDKCRSLKTEENRHASLGIKKWLTTAQAADYLGVTVSAIRNYIYRQQINAYKPFGPHGRCLINRFELDDLIERSKTY